MSSPWPKRFLVARHLIVVGWILAAICLMAGAVQLYLWFADRNAQRLVAVAVAGLLPAFLAWAMRKPVAQLESDAALLPSAWPGKLVRVPYHDIVGLTKVPQVWFTVIYHTSRGRRLAHLQPERIDRFDELEAALKEATGLEVLLYEPAWAKPVRVMLRAFPREEWQSYLLAPLFMLLGILAGMATLVGFAALCAYWGVRSPSWLTVALPTVIILAVFCGLVWLRARRRSHHAQEAPPP